MLYRRGEDQDRGVPWAYYVVELEAWSGFCMFRAAFSERVWVEWVCALGGWGRLRFCFFFALAGFRLACFVCWWCGLSAGRGCARRRSRDRLDGYGAGS